jgi:hypothetical protein
MMTSLVDHDADEPLRSRQEREIEFGHTLSEAEHDLAWEAFHFGRTLELAGIAFDPLTYIALRIVEGSIDEQTNPVDCLNVLGAFGFLERSVAIAVELLDEAA